ncbi:ABC-2 transporter permease [Lentibacillus sp. N15]|uniref:ABC-2 transporter permease n=1 Tax=Lentibacillus songyuanensis TaxID=3136161 RepID=UPI0031BB7D44
MLINLLRRELRIPKPYFYLLGFVLFIPFTKFFTSGEPIDHIMLLIVLAFWIPLNVAYDEQPALINSLPVTRSKIVLAKYISGVMWFIPAAVIVCTYVFLFDQYAPFPTRLMTGRDILLAFSGLCLAMSVFHPLGILSGYITAGLLTAVCFVTVSIIINMVINIYHNPSLTYLDGFVETILANQSLFRLLLIVISLIVTWLSYKLSVHYYEKKGF